MRTLVGLAAWTLIGLLTGSLSGYQEVLARNSVGSLRNCRYFLYARYLLSQDGSEIWACANVDIESVDSS